MKEISPEFSVNREEYSSENRETYWKNIFNFKRLKVSAKKKFTGMLETDGATICVHYRRLKKDRPVPPSAESSAKDEENKEANPETQKLQDDDLVVGAVRHEENKEADLATQEVQDNDLVVGADPENTNIITIVVPKHAEDGTDGNFRQKDTRVLRFSRARNYRESDIMNARKKIETWNAGIKDQMEALSELTSRRADVEAFRKFMEVRIAHWDARWEEYPKPRWARLRMNLYCGN